MKEGCSSVSDSLVGVLNGVQRLVISGNLLTHVHGENGGNGIFLHCAVIGFPLVTFQSINCIRSRKMNVFLLSPSTLTYVYVTVNNVVKRLIDVLECRCCDALFSSCPAEHWTIFS